MRLVLSVLLVVLAMPLAAQEDVPPAPYAYRQLDNPALEASAQELMETLRCLKCQSQSIADSDASMAGDMRHQVRIRIAAGEEPEVLGMGGNTALRSPQPAVLGADGGVGL